MLWATGGLGRARYALTDRSGGVSAPPYDALNLAEHVGDAAAAVAENRSRLLTALPGARRLAFMSQVHGCAVAVDPAAVPEADALVVTEPGVAAVVLTADCVPVLLAGRDHPVVAAVHAGRLGVAREVVPAAVAALEQHGVPARDVVALVGPAVCGRCYAVPAELRAEVAGVVPEAYARTRDGMPSLDLPAAVAAQLTSAGVGDVTLTGACTVEDPAFFSYRRAAVTGRIAACAWVPA